MALGGRARPPRRRRSGGALGQLLRGVLALLLLALLGAGGLLWATLPAAEAELQLAGLGAPVAITLDAAGIPRIRAETEHDATMALGWLHARDRLFQMDLMRRGVAGRLAEWAGPAVLRNDRFLRLLDLAGRARADLAALPAETRDLLDSYAAGVNAWIAARGRLAAPEYLLLGTPEPWRPEHSLYWGKLMGLWLSGDWRVELERARLAGVLPAERIDALWPPDPSTRPNDAPAALPPATPPRFGAADHLSRLAAALPRFPEAGTLPGSASNAWVLAGSRTAGGAPLLASDPHLGFSAPILWYLARIDLPGGRLLAGATSPGVPFFVIGRNERLAWGFTTSQADTQDIFEERLAGPDRYDTPEGPRPFTRREEVIAIRGAPPETLLVRETRHGPVLSDLDSAAPGGPPAGQVLAVGMANLAPEDSSAAGLHLLNRARSLAEARAAAARINGVSQNLLVADAAGPIGMYVTGRIPRRAGGDGSRPARGWDGSGDWTGFLAFDDLPQQENPVGGLLANANNRLVPADPAVFLGRDWPGDFRLRRIQELFAAPRPYGAEELTSAQVDVVSLLARDLLRPRQGQPEGVFRRMPPLPGAAGTARELLLAWDATMRPALAQPLIFNAWARRFHALALAAGGVPADGFTAARPEFIAWLLGPEGRPDPWCSGDCTALAARALTEAVAGLVASQGPDPSAWRWGSVHVARLEHPFLRVVPGLQALFRLHAVTPGDGETLGRGAIAGYGPQPYAHVHGAGLRLVADLADPDRTLAVIATGQSGHPLSRHWGDLLPLWRDGGMLTLGRRPAEVFGSIRLAP